MTNVPTLANQPTHLSDAERIVSTRYAAGTARTVVIIALGWHLANDLPATLASGPDAVCLAVWLAFAAVGVAGSVAVLKGVVIGQFWRVAGCLVLLAGAAVMHATTEAASLFSFENWAWGAAGWMALLLFWNRPGARHPIWAFFVFVAANAAISLVALIARGEADRTGLAKMLVVSYGIAVLQLTLYAGKWGLESTVRRFARDRTATELVRAAKQAAEQAHIARQDRYATARAAAGEVLTGLADGRLDPADPSVRQRAAAAAARLRRLVTETDDVPDPLVHELRAAADVAERRGVAVTVDQVGVLPTVPLQVRRALTDAPAWAVAAAGTHARITVVSNVESVTVAVVGDASIDQPRSDEPVTVRHDDVMVRVDQEGGQIWVETRWSNAPSVSP
jgi:hypothetical protein